MFAKGDTVIQLFEAFAPRHYAMPDDKIGLQVGTLRKEIKKILIALDVTEEVVDEAIDQKVDLIIAHHAVIYRPLKEIRTDTAAGRIYEKLIKHDISVYIAHTNLDVADGGINDIMAELLNLDNLSPLENVHTENLFKLVVFVPEDHHERVLQAIFNAGAGWIGQYSHCSFNLRGQGTFLAQEGADPFLGEVGKLKIADEVRIETIVPQSIQRKVIQAMLKAHPYEEVAYDLYPMDLKGRSFGIGRVGTLPEVITLETLIEKVKLAFDVNHLRFVGDPNRKIRKVAVLGGSGSRFVKHAIFHGADCLVTGDIDYHTAIDALADGITLIDPGHNVEKVMKSRIAEYMQEKLQEAKYKTEVLSSEVNTEPFRFA